MPRTIQQTAIRGAFLSLEAEIDRVRAAFLEVEQYYHRNAVRDPEPPKGDPRPDIQSAGHE
jgi:hypothetical protein